MLAPSGKFQVERSTPLRASPVNQPVLETGGPGRWPSAESDGIKYPVLAFLPITRIAPQHNLKIQFARNVQLIASTGRLLGGVPQHEAQRLTRKRDDGSS